MPSATTERRGSARRFICLLPRWQRAVRYGGSPGESCGKMREARVLAHELPIRERVTGERRRKQNESDPERVLGEGVHDRVDGKVDAREDRLGGESSGHQAHRPALIPLGGGGQVRLHFFTSGGRQQGPPLQQIPFT